MMENILLTKFKEVSCQEPSDWSSFKCDSIMSAYKMREECVRQYAWAIPNDEAIQTLVEHSPIIEMGAGTGYWAALVKDAGGDIIAYDRHPPSEDSPSNPYHDYQLPYFPVKRGGIGAVSRNSNRTLFLCWPPYNQAMAFQMLRAYTGNTVIFVGEGEGGCTANDEFFEKLQCEFYLEKEVAIPQWYGLHDRMSIYSRVIL